jgi:hypothetical protein
MANMAIGRTRLGRWAAIAVSMILAALLYAVPAVAADRVDTGSADSSTPTLTSQQGVEWTDILRNSTGTTNRGSGRTILGMEWTSRIVESLGVEWTD